MPVQDLPMPAQRRIVQELRTFEERQAVYVGGVHFDLSFSSIASTRNVPTSVPHTTASTLTSGYCVANLITKARPGWTTVISISVNPSQATGQARKRSPSGGKPVRMKTIPAPLKASR